MNLGAHDVAPAVRIPDLMTPEMRRAIASIAGNREVVASMVAPEIQRMVALQLQPVITEAMKPIMDTILAPMREAMAASIRGLQPMAVMDEELSAALRAVGREPHTEETEAWIDARFGDDATLAEVIATLKAEAADAASVASEGDVEIPSDSTHSVPDRTA